MRLQQKLKSAQEQQFAILAVNFYNFETLKGILQAAAELGKPIILQLTRASIEYMGLKTATEMARAAIVEYDVEAWLHLDHADSIELVQRCLDSGFDSVMIDASEKPFEENIEITKKVVEMAQPYGANVEAELGYVAKLGQSAEKRGFTEPEEAKEFVDATNVNALAVAIGSAHGFYKKKPKLDLKRLSEIRRTVAVPLVLHGASGIPADDIREAVRRGICKVNVATDVKNTFMLNLKKQLNSTNEIDLRKVFPYSINAVKDLVKEKINYLGK